MDDVIIFHEFSDNPEIAFLQLTLLVVSNNFADAKYGNNSDHPFYTCYF